MLFISLLFIFVLRNLEVQGLYIDTVDPLSLKINTEKLEAISITLALNEQITNRANAKINLSREDNKNKIYNASTKQDEHNLKKVEFSIDPKDFIDHYGKYSLTYINDESIEFNQTIFIYNNYLILKNPINRYELTDEKSYDRTVKYEFQYSIVEDEINRILYYDESNPFIKNLLSKNKYKLEDGKLIITFPGSSKVITYSFDIYPEYDKNNSNSEIHRFYLHFHDYLLKDEAIYIDKQKGSNLVSFNTLFKQSYSSKPFTIYDSGANIDCSSFSCRNDGSYFLCDCALNFTRRNSPGKIIITYDNGNKQERELFLILYTNFMRLCYEKTEIEDLIINMEWIDDMEYDHFLYFTDLSDSIPKILTPIFGGKRNSIITYSYKISTLSLGSNKFYLESSIPSLNFNDYNLVDINNLFIYIYPNTQLENPINSFVFTHNSSNQTVNLTFDDDVGQILNDLVLKKDDDDSIKINIYKGKECQYEGISYICNLKDIIYDYEDEKNGNYSIYYNSACGKELKIEGRIVTIKRGISLLSISPSWINKTKVDGTNITLTYDYKINENISICLYNSHHPISNGTCLFISNYFYRPASKSNQFIIITLKDIDEGFYYVRTSVFKNNLLDKDITHIINESLGFKVSDDNIVFDFSHHYFVLNNNDNNRDSNKLIIKVTDNSGGHFGCKIIENSEKQNLTHNNCSYFEYQIKKIGTIKFSYYDNDGFIIPINDNITVVQYYTELFSYISLKTCYYHNFEIDIDILDSYKNKFKLFLYLKSIENNYYLNLTNSQNDNKYSLEKSNDSLIKNIFYLYVSENYFDKEVILHKFENNITFTSITAPAFIIDPNMTISFSDIRCDLSKSKFIMKKKGDNLVQKILNNCKYNSNIKILSCNISGSFYNNDRYYKNYYYSIDDKNITFFDNKTNEYTFVSKKLSEDIFKIDKTNKTNNGYYFIIIENPNKDFYFPLIDNLTNYKNGRQIVYKRGSTDSNKLEIDDNNYKIEFKESLKLNEILEISHLTRKKESWEINIENNTLFHFFNEKIDNKLSVIPNIFAYNDISKDEYPISIIFDNEEDKLKYTSYGNLKNCTNPEYIDNFDKCIDLTSAHFISNIAQDLYISIGNEENKANIKITFIYYALSDSSKECKTKTDNMDNIILNVFFPDNSLINKFHIESEISIVDTTYTTNSITYTLKGSEIIIPETYIDMYIDDEIFDHTFTLQDIGLNVIPKYNFSLNNNEKTIYLIPDNNKEQKATIYLRGENNENANISDIREFIIKNENTGIGKKLVTEKVSENSVNIKFENIAFSLNYKLYYIDRCGKEIKTDIKIEFYSFSLKRNYFVLNNNKANNTRQELIIEGSYSNTTDIIIKKDEEYHGTMNHDSNSKHYYTILDSQGNYTFYISINGNESPLKEIVYVRNNLEDLFIINKELPNCQFLDEEKKELGQISYTISSKDETIKDINIFKSQFTINNSSYTDLSTIVNSNQETFTLDYGTNIKSNIKRNENLYIYLTENDDKNQPIYVFKYKYTNIKLNSEFSEFIYTDNIYISFNMSCKINNIDTFILNNSNNKNYKINCEERTNNYNEQTNIYMCYLSSNDKERNELLKFGSEEFDYGYYDIKYKDYKITDQELFLSHEINTTSFTIEKEEEISPGVNTTVKIIMNEEIFYSPNIESVKYGIRVLPVLSLDSYCDHVFNLTENKNYITASINIAKNYDYGIKQICRKPCSYCRNPDCQDLNVDYTISSNTPFVTFEFNKHYIALFNSQIEEGSPIPKDTLEIKISGEDANQVDFLIYNRSHEGIEYNETINEESGFYYIKNIQVGRYTFKYHVRNGKNISIKNEIVFVVNYDYELFNYTELTKNCLYYNKLNKGIFVSITKNPDYKYEDEIIESKMEIFLDDYEFELQQEKGYIIKGEFSQNFDYNGKIYTLKLRETAADKYFIFSIISYNTKVTSFDLNEDYYYKDNIVLDNQYCKLDNIYIFSEFNKNEDYSLLKCEENNESNKKYYCDAIYYTFLAKKRDNFGIYIGNPRQNQKSSTYFNTEEIVLIYNSIEDSDFELNYNGSFISISSSNFDMGHIKEIKINNNSNSSPILLENSNLIYKFQNNDSVESYLNELIRIDHKQDLKKTIKNKTVNLRIIQIECPEYYLYDNSNNLCYTCAQKSLSNGGKDKWYQNGKCVEKCNGGFAIYDTERFICLNCTDKTNISNTLYCGCYEGTVRADDDNICYLPDDEKIKKLLIIRPNMQCWLRDGKSHNYCNANGTKTCEIKSYSGYSFPDCICKDGYSGKYCEFEDNSPPNLKENLIIILNLKDDKIDEENANVIAKVRGIIFFLEKDNNNYYTNLIYENNIDNIDKYINSTIRTIRNDINNNYTNPQIYDIIELAIYFLQYNIKTRRLRNLEEDQDKLNYILENAHYLNYLIGNSTTNYNIQSDGLNLISFISYQKRSTSDASFLTYIKNTTYNSNTTGYINLLNNDVGDEDALIITFFNGLLFKEDFEGVKVRFSTNNKSVIPSTLNNFILHLYSSNINVNFQLANYYLSKNIAIYNKYDKCFTEPCYFNKKFEFDLTQKYRKMHVFQRWSADSLYCKYYSFEEISNTVELSCQQFEPDKGNNETIEYGELSIIMKKDYIDKQSKVYNLPMRCPKKIDSLDGNYGFWIFLIMFILEIIYIIGINILTFGSLRKISIRKGLYNDELLYKIPLMSNSEDIEKKSNDIALKKKIIYESTNIRGQYPYSDENNEYSGYFNKDFIDCLYLNFRELYPFFSLFRVSIISPLIINSWFFLFNILGLFGFNALIYYEGLIEKRIYDKKRNKFDYSMRKEFHKIILSILCQAALTVLIKFLVRVSLKQRDNLEAGLKQCKRIPNYEIGNDTIVTIDLFEEQMLLRRLIGGILMLIISVFFFYYSVVFCGIYIKTQRNWVFGGIWCLFWDWIVFAPIYIIVISYIEFKKQDSYNPLVYSLKRLFCF